MKYPIYFVVQVLICVTLYVLLARFWYVIWKTYYIRKYFWYEARVLITAASASTIVLEFVCTSFILCKTRLTKSAHRTSRKFCLSETSLYCLYWLQFAQTVCVIFYKSPSPETPLSTHRIYKAARIGEELHQLNIFHLFRNLLSVLFKINDREYMLQVRLSRATLEFSF